MMEIVHVSKKRRSQEEQHLITSFFSEVSGLTRKKYLSNFSKFAFFLDNTTQIPQASWMESLFFWVKFPRMDAFTIASLYKNFLTEKGLSASTVNNHLASLRSFSSHCFRFGFIDWKLEIKSQKPQPYRDTKGVELKVLDAILKELSTPGCVENERKEAKRKRDFAIFRLLFDLALRTHEIVAIDLKDLVLSDNFLLIKGKGRDDLEKMAFGDKTKKALLDWLEFRGTSEGALFWSFGPSSLGKRLSKIGLLQLVSTMGNRLNIRLRPHMVRKTSITEASRQIQALGRPIEQLLKHSRHKNLNTALIYLDQSKETQGEISNLVSWSAG